MSWNINFLNLVLHIIRQTFHSQPPTSYLHARSVGWSCLRRFLGILYHSLFLLYRFGRLESPRDSHDDQPPHTTDLQPRLQEAEECGHCMFCVVVMFTFYPAKPSKRLNLLGYLFLQLLLQTHHWRIIGCPWPQNVHSLHNSNSRSDFVIFHHLLRQLITLLIGERWKMVGKWWMVGDE